MSEAAISDRAVRVRVAFGMCDCYYRVGDIIPDMPAAYRQQMIRRGFVEKIAPVAAPAATLARKVGRPKRGTGDAA